MGSQQLLSASTWQKYYKKNNYYHKDVESLVQKLIPEYASVLEIGCKGGELLNSLKNKDKTGVSLNNDLFKLSKKRYRKISFFEKDQFPKKITKKYDYIIISHTLSDIEDIQALIQDIKKISHSTTKVIVVYFSFLWKPILDIAERFGLRLPQKKEPNWLSSYDVDNFFTLEDFEKIKSGKKFVFPFPIPIISNMINKYVSRLPLANSFCLTNYSVFKPASETNNYSVSIIIPARNEAGNMKVVLKKIPRFAKNMEIIFVEGNSKDDTYNVIKKEIDKYKGPFELRLLKQKGVGKGDAVRLGFAKAKNQLLMILDADLTVDPKELPKFYEAAVSGKGGLIMGTRLVYPMEKLAMRVLNYMGNKFFSIAFTFLLGQKIRDTLCGTKVLTMKNYKLIEKNRHVFGDFDPFGDFDLIFGASKLNLKILEIPIRYKERVYGETNISRFSHGLLLFRMVYFAAKNLKFV